MLFSKSQGGKNLIKRELKVKSYVPLGNLTVIVNLIKRELIGIIIRV